MKFFSSIKICPFCNLTLNEELNVGNKCNKYCPNNKCDILFIITQTCVKIHRYNASFFIYGDNYTISNGELITIYHNLDLDNKDSFISIVERYKKIHFI